MNIALIGYGKMGKVIEEVALERGHKVVAKFTKYNPVTASDMSGIDAAIEFTNPESALNNIQHCISKKVPVIIGSTGWYDHLNMVIRACNENNSAMIYATNFSLGVNLFFKLNETLAEWMSAHDNYQAKLTEIHHTEKLDSPSGTAITTAEGIISKHPRYTNWKESEQTELSTLPIKVLREHDVKGTHIVNYDSEVDSIEIKHTAHSRKGFGLGAVVAAEWIQGKTGVFTMRDVLNLL